MGKETVLLRKFFSHELAWLIIIGVLLRLAMMPYFSCTYDTNAYCSSLIWFLNRYDPYSIHVSIYPPFIYFFDFPLFSLAYQFGLSPGYHYVEEAASIGSVSGLVTPNQVNPLFLVLWKIPLLCFDLLTGLLVYCFAKELTNNPRTPKLFFVIWFFNPFTLVISYFHGAYDVIVAFFVLLGSFFIYSRNYFSAGLSFGLGTLAKVSPIYTALPIAVITLCKGGFRRSSRSDLKANVLDFSKFTTGLLIPLLLFAPLLIEYVRSMLFWVTNEVSIGGGLNQWFFATYPIGWEVVNTNIDIIQKVFYLSPVISLIICFLLCRFLKWNHEWHGNNSLLAITLFTALTYFFASSVVQPQYLLWILPLLVVLSITRRVFIVPLFVLSVAGLVFLLSVQGPHAFLYPLAIYTPLTTPKQIGDTILWYMDLPGKPPYLWQNLCTVFGGIGFVGLLLTIYLIVTSLRHGDRC